MNKLFIWILCPVQAMRAEESDISWETAWWVLKSFLLEISIKREKTNHVL